MHDELKEVLAQGDCELYRTAGESAEYTLRGGRACRVIVVAGAAPVEWVMDGPGGATVTCSRVVVVARRALQGTPQPGDRVRLANGECLQVMRVTGSAHDPSWHLDCALVTA